MTEAIEKSGHKDTVRIGLDVASSEFYNAEEKKYDLSWKLGTKEWMLNYTEFIDLYEDLTKNFPIVSIEDPFD